MRSQFRPGNEVLVIATVARTEDLPCVDSGFFGFPVADALIGAEYVMDIQQVERIIASSASWIATPARGDLIYWQTDGGIANGGALTKTAGSNRLVGVITAIGPLFGVAGDKGVTANQLIMLVLPQAARP